MDGSLGGFDAALSLSPACARVDEDEVFDCREVISGFEDLPREVRRAPITRIEGRLLDRSVLAELITQPPPANGEVGWSTRILKREAALMPYVGKVLFCALIRLPGVQYTVEVDPAAQAVVYWEWQSI